MLLFRDIIVFTVVAVGLGIGSAFFAVNNSDQLGLFQLGPWRSWPNAASPLADPYTKADRARKGAIGLGASEGLAFVSITDDNGTPLDGACQYRIYGTHLPARFWTLSLVTLNGELVDNPSKRYGFHSLTIAKRDGLDYEIVTGPNVMGGNWLKSETDTPFQLVLRLYESPLTSGGGFGDLQLPNIAWVSCQ